MEDAVGLGDEVGVDECRAAAGWAAALVAAATGVELGQVGVNSAVGLGEMEEAQPAAPPTTSAVRAMQGHLTDRARILAGPLGFPGPGIPGDVALESPT